MAGTDSMLAKINRMPTSQKISILAIMIVSFAAMMIFYTWIQKADYQVLFSNLSETDAGRIVQELKAKRIPYKLEGGGLILVPSADVYDLRLQLASSGLPQGGGIGFELFDETSFTTSEFVQKLNFRRALEGELSRTIRSMSAIEQARVHLVVPEKTVFAFQDNKPKASAAIFISLGTGRSLNSSEVNGIVHIVSSSVEGLGSDNITVVDSNGKLLTKPSDDSMLSMGNTQMEYRHSYEKNMISKIVSILEPVVGVGKIQAKVSSQFDFTRSERTEETFDPEGIVVRSEQKRTEKSTSGRGGGGVPGTASNLPGGASAQASSSGSESQKQDEMINYETSKTITRVVESPVTLERITVAILIDGLLPSQQGSVANPDDYIKRSEDDVRYYEDIVRKTIGFTADRGDEISVTVMPFTKIDTGETMEVEQSIMPLVYTVLKYFVPVLVALLFILLVIRPLISIISKTPQPALRGPASNETDELLEPLKTKEIPIQSQVIDWATDNPQQAAGVVKGWVGDN